MCIRDREKRALIVQSALRLFAIVLALCLTMLLSLVCFKPWKDLRSLAHERSFLHAHLEKSREQMEQAKNEFIWISPVSYTHLDVYKRQAASYLSRGNFCWNAGMFVWSIPAVCEQLDKHCPELALSLIHI